MVASRTEVRCIELGEMLRGAVSVPCYFSCNERLTVARLGGLVCAKGGNIRVCRGLARSAALCTLASLLA